MKTASAKAKGRNVCKIIKELILEKYPTLQEDDIKITSSGATGEDLFFSPLARKTLPISIECKARQSIAVYEWLEQAKANSKQYIPIVFARGDRKDPIAIIDANDLFKLLELYKNK